MQLGEYRASTHKQMRVLPPELVAGFDDFAAVFGSGADALSFQSAEVQTTDQRVWVLLVGQRHHLQRWVADVRRPRASFSTVYRGLIPTIPGSLPWLSAVLEPVRAAHFPSLQLLAAPASLATLGRDRSDVRVALCADVAFQDRCGALPVLVLDELRCREAGCSRAGQQQGHYHLDDACCARGL